MVSSKLLSRPTRLSSKASTISTKPPQPKPTPNHERQVHKKDAREDYAADVSWGPSFPNSRPHVTPRTPKSRTCSHNQESAQAKAIPHRTKHFRPFPPQTTGSPKTRFRTAWKPKAKLIPREQRFILLFYRGCLANSVELAKHSTTQQENNPLQTQFRLFSGLSECHKTHRSQKEELVPFENVTSCHPVGKHKVQRRRKPAPPPTIRRPRFTPLELREPTFPNNPQFES